MKTRIVETEGTEQEKIYPYLGILPSYDEGSRYIVLFYEPQTGIVVTAEKDAPRSVGEHLSDWSEESFNRFNDSVRLEN